MKEYEKLAREATEEYCVGPKYNYNFPFEAGFKQGFLKAREMMSKHGFYESVEEMYQAIKELGENEIT